MTTATPAVVDHPAGGASAVTVLAEARTLPWATLAGVASVAAAALVATRPWATTQLGLTVVRVVAMILAAGVAFTIDDAAAVIVSPSPTTLAVRRTIRIGLGFAGALVVLGALVAIGGAVAGGIEDMRAAAVLLQLLALTAFGVAVASIPQGPRSTIGGSVGAGAVLGFATTAFIVQARWPKLSLFPGGTFDPGWRTAQFAWAAILFASAMWLAHMSRDPAA